MEREAFRQRMQQYKQARENNPQLKYWDWKKYADGGIVDEELEDIKKNNIEVKNKKENPVEEQDTEEEEIEEEDIEDKAREQR